MLGHLIMILPYFLGVCICNTNYAGSDCSLSTSVAPVVVTLSQDVYSITTPGGSVTTSTLVLGDQFINSPSLVCHQETAEVTISAFKIRKFLKPLSFFLVVCITSLVNNYGQLYYPYCSWASLPLAGYQYLMYIDST